ncbi:MAG TPA: hypothetical protein VGD62_03490 [Acidobacteriaceae bacterium]
MNLVMLICASLAALAFGVLAAQLLCRVAFSALRLHARSIAPAQVAGAEAALVTKPAIS